MIKNGNTIIPLIYDNAGDFSENLACVKVGEKWGYIDKSNQTLIPLIYGYAGSFNKGLARVQKDGKYFVINNIGKCVENCPE